MSASIATSMPGLRERAPSEVLRVRRARDDDRAFAPWRLGLTTRRQLRERTAQDLLVAFRELAGETRGPVAEHAGQQLEGRGDAVRRLEQDDRLLPPALAFEQARLLAMLARAGIRERGPVRYRGPPRITRRAAPTPPAQPRRGGPRRRRRDEPGAGIRHERRPRIRHQGDGAPIARAPRGPDRSGTLRCGRGARSASSGSRNGRAGCGSCRVSSASTQSASRSTRSARKVTSSRLPIGVATMWSVPIPILAVRPLAQPANRPGRGRGTSIALTRPQQRPSDDDRR